MSIQIYTEVNDKVKEIVNRRLSGRDVSCNYESNSSRKSHSNRYIQVKTSFPNMDTIHYEFVDGYWELHIEPSNKKDGYKYGRIVNYLQEYSEKKTNIKWHNEGWRDIARYEKAVDDYKQLEEILIDLYDIFDIALAECAEIFKPLDLSLQYTQKYEAQKIEVKDEVTLKTLHLGEVFDLQLKIPDYQRIYCWNDKNITTLWNNLIEMPDSQDYHLGAIILHNSDTGFHIIDGQQRLVTLTIILRALGYDRNLPLLTQRFISNEACENIANAKYVISGLVSSIRGEKDVNQILRKKIAEKLTFSVLILNSSCLDLAYTFFSNQNSRGVRLSDFDVLKAHHLRFLIMNEQQAEHLARRWNSVSQEYDFNNETLMHNTLGLHLYRMRKWMRKQSCDFSNSDRPIKDEYTAANLIPGIPPFGERFYFYEKIQGGSHFFAYADHFFDLYKQFVKTPQIRMLRKNLLFESHWKYESVIETILFGYYSKFGIQYLSEALFCVASVIAGHRYESRALQYKINQYVMDRELIMMIDQASSPSFFLAETLSHIKKSGRDLEGNDIKVRFYKSLRNIFKDLNGDSLENEEDLRLAKFTDSYIEKLKIEEYE